MKKASLILLIISLALCVSCNKDDEGPESSSNSLLGTWEYVQENGSIKLEFNADMTLTHTLDYSPGAGSLSVEYVYEHTASQIKVFISGVQVNSASYVIQGDILTTQILSDNDISYTKVE